jgi:hypothetical protein
VIEGSWPVAAAGSTVRTVRLLPLARDVQAALAQAAYERDEDGAVIVQAPGATGSFARRDTFEAARTNLRDVIEGSARRAPAGAADPPIGDIPSEERDVETVATQA